MIYATVSMTVENGEAKCDEKIHLCRGDKNVELRFILENPFVVANTTYAQMIIKRPSTMPIFSEKAAIENNVVIFSITEDMIDELSEIGAYDIQIRLYDDLNARVTLPPVSAALEITEAIA